MTATDWLNTAQHLRLMASGPDADTLIETLCGTVETVDPSEAAPVLVHALSLADSVFVRARTAHVLAQVAADGDIDAVDALIEVSRQQAADDYLASELLHALGTLALRNTAAYASCLSILARIKSIEPPFLLVRAAKVIGRLERERGHTGLRGRLDELTKAESPTVQAEALYQQGLLALADALLAPDFPAVEEALRKARLIFLRAEANEEARDDSSAFVLLLDATLELFGAGPLGERAVRVDKITRDLSVRIGDPYARSWFGYRTPLEQKIMLSVLRIGDALRAMTASVSDIERWTNFDAALVEVAAAYQLMASEDQGGFGSLDEAFSRMAPLAVAPNLGPVLLNAVGRVRFQTVISALKARKGEGGAVRSLQSLYDAILPHAHEVLRPIGEDVLHGWEAEAAKHGESSDFFVSRLMKALKAGQVEAWARDYGYDSPPLSIDNASLLGGDPQVDVTARKLLEQVRQRLQTYPSAQWTRLVDVCVKLAQIFQAIRDDLPVYTLSELDNKGKGKQGLGQQATERDLQDDLFNRLRLSYGRVAEYELTSIAGGRSDAGLKFSDVQFPIEVKAEYSTVGREHIRKNYLTQADTYATARDRVSFVLILDVRKSHSRQQPAKGSGTANSPAIDQVKLYGLDESFWVDGLSVDPQIEGAKHNAVIFGLVPGNLRKPSTLTVYSRRPSADKLLLTGTSDTNG